MKLTKINIFSISAKDEISEYELETQNLEKQNVKVNVFNIASTLSTEFKENKLLDLSPIREIVTMDLSNGLEGENYPSKIEPIKSEWFMFLFLKKWNWHVFCHAQVLLESSSSSQIILPFNFSEKINFVPRYFSCWRWSQWMWILSLLDVVTKN